MDARELSDRLSQLLRREHAALAEFLVALASFDERRGWEALGYSGLFTYLHRELGLSKGAAFYRKTAAELVRRFPEIVAPLGDGRLCITSVAELAKVLTAENRSEVIPRFFHRSKDEAREVVAELRPVERPPLRDVVTALGTPPAARVAAELRQEPVLPAGERVPSAVVTDVPGLGLRGFPENLLDANSHARMVNAPSSRAERDTVEPLTAELSRFHVTVSRRFLAKLEAAREALSHSHPGANAEAILEAGLDLLLAKAAKQKGLVEKPRRERRPAKPDHIPAEVKRAVWARDGGCCQSPLENGGVCGSRHRLQFDHIRPKAQGGASTVDNVRVLCASHNLRAARIAFGDSWMDRCTGGRRAIAAAAPAERGRPKPSAR
jgi:hypothetical protein